MTTVEDYDAVIIGASFGGLAAAAQLQGTGRVLLADRQAPGDGETSACGTLLAVLERLDALDALEQVHPTIAINAGKRRIGFQPAYPFATFDYRTLCKILASRLPDVEIAVAPFGGRDDDGALRVGDRRVKAPVLIDASGWRAVLARTYGAPPSDSTHRSVGMELRHGHGGCNLEFWARPDDCPDGVFWAFPAGGEVREGVATYTGKGKRLRSSLAEFVHEHELAPRAVHGGVFPSRLRDQVAGPVFVVGDAAGQCLPLTGEGIRPALVWGQEAGRQAARVIRGETDLDTALDTYQAQVLAHRWQYRLLERLQSGLLRAPRPLLPMAVRAFASGPIARAAQRSYWELADPDRLQVAPGVWSEARATAEQCAVGPAANTNATGGACAPLRARSATS
ncbi:MAG: NAD(P)/FAD-dependent oxidoreductase [Actinobacteria bacterium]|nr:NAD(P)/FAD-dependent oxidoreductase [Actinomycetota bacterium]